MVAIFHSKQSFCIGHKSQFPNTQTIIKHTPPTSMPFPLGLSIDAELQQYYSKGLQKPLPVSHTHTELLIRCPVSSVYFNWKHSHIFICGPRAKWLPDIAYKLTHPHRLLYTLDLVMHPPTRTPTHILPEVHGLRLYVLPKYTISNKINNKTHVCLINNETAYATYVWKYTNTNGQAHVPSRLLSGADEKRAQQDIDIQNTHTQCG